VRCMTDRLEAELCEICDIVFVLIPPVWHPRAAPRHAQVTGGKLTVNSSAKRPSLDAPSSETDSTVALNEGPQAELSPAAVRAEMEKILAAAGLRDSHLLQRFLRYVVGHTLAGEHGQLKEYSVAVDVFERDASFDPRVDPVVRMAARRLRQKLQEYYACDGAQDLLRIDIPKGGYSAVFHALPASVPEPSDAVAPADDQAREDRRFLGWANPAFTRFAWAALSVVVALGIAYWIYGLRVNEARVGPEKIMLAVMPFANLSGDLQQEYFSDGITEEFITRLASIDPRRLGVIARTSVMGYKNTSKHVDEIGRELGVQYILEGSVRRDGSRARITAELVQVSDQTHLWSQSYDGDSRDLLELESRIGEAAVKEVSVKLNHARATPQLASLSVQRANGRVAAIDPEAHELYLRGRYFWSKRSYLDILKGLDYFQRAVAKDPNYAVAYVGIADAYGMLAANDQAPAEEVVPKARDTAQRALRMDPGLAEAHAVLAHIKFFYDWDFPAAEAEYRRALELNSGSADVHHFYGVMLMWTGRLQEAASQLREAEVLDPLSSVNSAALGLDYLYSGKEDEAMRQARKTLESAPDDAVPHVLLGFCYERKNLYTLAVEELRKAVVLSHRDSETLGWLGWVLALDGQRTEAEKILAELQAAPSERYAATHDVAMIYAGLGDNESALRYLDEAVTRREADALDIKMQFAWQALRSDARFQALLRRSGLLVNSG
jgi:TolB-like protein/Tfp pilus assembly protein PilF